MFWFDLGLLLIIAFEIGLIHLTMESGLLLLIAIEMFLMELTIGFVDYLYYERGMRTGLVVFIHDLIFKDEE